MFQNESFKKNVKCSAILTKKQQKYQLYCVDISVLYLLILCEKVKAHYIVQIYFLLTNMKRMIK